MTAQEAAERLRKHGDWMNDHKAEPSPYHVDDGWDGARFDEDRAIITLAYLAEHPADDGEKLTEEWLQEIKASQGGLCYSILLPTTTDGAAIIEVEITPPAVDGDEWDVSLVQNAGPTDDPSDIDDIVTITSRPIRTRGDLRSLLRGLGVK